MLVRRRAALCDHTGTHQAIHFCISAAFSTKQSVCVFTFDILRSGLTTGGETPPSHSAVVLTDAELRGSFSGSCDTQWGLRSFPHVCVENASEVCCTLSAD